MSFGGVDSIVSDQPVQCAFLWLYIHIEYPLYVIPLHITPVYSIYTALIYYDSIYCATTHY